jgi:hypothetical protein
MSRISFKQFISRRGKKDSRDGTFGGKGGLPSFSLTHPYFSGRLRIPNNKKDEDEGTARAARGGYDIPCGGVNQPRCPELDSHVRPPETEPCPWGVNIDGGPCPPRLFEPPDWTGEHLPDPEPYSGSGKPTKPHVGPCFEGEDEDGNCLDSPDSPEIPGPKSLDLLGCDLSGKIKYPKDSPCWQAMQMMRKSG